MTAFVTYIIEIHAQCIVGLQVIEDFVSVTFKSTEIFILVKIGCNTQSILFPRSLSCLCTESADFSSLKGKVIDTGLGWLNTALILVLGGLNSIKKQNQYVLQGISVSGYFQFKKRSLIKTILDHTKDLSYLADFFSNECNDLRKMFLPENYAN